MQLVVCDEDAQNAGIWRDTKEAKEPPILERCSLFVNDHAGILGVLHYLRPAGSGSCFEQPVESVGSLRLFTAHFAAGLRSALKCQSLLKEQRRFVAILQHITASILPVY